jgi:hypothetical protein
MLLSEAIALVLKRANLAEASTSYQDDARGYMSMYATEMLNLGRWWFANQETTFNTVDGTAVYTPVAANITDWESFVDETNNWPLQIVGSEQLDSLDADRSHTGRVEIVVVEGVHATTGFSTVRLWRTPDSVATIRVRYAIDLVAWSSSDDTSEMTALGIPPIITNVLIYGAVALFLEESGDDTGSQRETMNLTRATRAAQRRNVEMLNGNRRYLPIRGTYEDLPLIRIGTSLAVAP